MPSSDQPLLAQVDLFRDLPPRELKRLESVARRREFDAGQAIVKQGETGVGLYLILRGRVKVTESSGGDERELATLGPGQSFGEMALFRDYGRRSATVTATEPTEVLVLHRLDFLDELRQNPDIAIRLLDTLSQRLTAAQSRPGSS